MHLIFEDLLPGLPLRSKLGHENIPVVYTDTFLSIFFHRIAIRFKAVDFGYKKYKENS